ncbi:MAG: hypothetical protein PHV08_03475 [Sulfurovaceae bacterium]|nr:hypothetical protein [Sulfurovaceae bacterium]
MNENSLVNFLLGTVIGGVSVYFALKHQDEIIDKLHQLEEEYALDPDNIMESAKEKIDVLTKNIQSKVEQFKEDVIENKDDAINAIMQELTHLRKEVAKFKS